MNIVVFSKDRMCQLHALLASLTHYHNISDDNVSVIFKATDDDYKSGYSIVKNEFAHTSIGFIDESQHKSFKQCVELAVKKEQKLTMFLVDDIVFKGSFSESDDEIVQMCTDPQILCVSLRMWKGITYCYPTNSSVQLPSSYNNETKTWNWLGEQGDWGYPLSVDGHVFLTSFITHVMNTIGFTNPNSFEGNMAAIANHFGFIYPKMGCYATSKLLNIPANLVQTETKNRVANTVSANELKERFFAGDRVDFKRYANLANNAPHMDLPLVFIGGDK